MKAAYSEFVSEALSSVHHGQSALQVLLFAFSHLICLKIFYADNDGDVTPPRESLHYLSPVTSVCSLNNELGTDGRGSGYEVSMDGFCEALVRALERASAVVGCEDGKHGIVDQMDTSNDSLLKSDVQRFVLFPIKQPEVSRRILKLSHDG